MNRHAILLWCMLVVVSSRKKNKGTRQFEAKFASDIKKGKESKCGDIVAAARNGDMEVLMPGGHPLPKGQIEINCKDKHGFAPLHHAARKGQMVFLEALLDLGADVKNVDRRGWTPLYEAAFWGQSTATKRLLKAGSDVTTREKTGKEALHIACMGRSENVPRIVNNLIKGNANVNAQDNNGWTPLHYAVENLCTGCVKKLIKNGANPKQKDKKDESPLMLAKRLDHATELYGVMMETWNEHRQREL